MFLYQEYSLLGLLIEYLRPGVTGNAEIVLAPTLPPIIHDDPSDDKFLEAAVAGKASYIVSGDNHLVKLSEYQGIRILKPRDFVQRYLRGK
jgi:predicted nucleic acid-binding protein